MMKIILSDFYIIVKGNVKYMPKRILYKNTILNGFKILEDLSSEKGKARVKAICPICGKEFIGYPKTIKNGDCKSCGCLKRIAGLKNLELANQNKKSNRIYYKNQYINNFYIIEDLPIEDKKEKISWVKALCPFCNNPFNVRVKDIKSGNTKSCGCTKSHGEAAIIKILNENNIIYCKEYTFSNLKYKKPLHFDFAIFSLDNKLSHLIEFDGIQHFQIISSTWSTPESLQLNQYRDNLKNEYCKQNNIPLIRIPYTHLGELCLEDLLLETSKFLLQDSV